ncbi:unnamed protein product [Arctia plantaginis]|uniref:Reverse transcriptase domain-containing protein n=1 Tax=Arctia plantaginis TaxID=874455 RepID=A0A8S0ZC53_ARCPL|nr:unnamed protein product [Arctia plantaginis]
MDIRINEIRNCISPNTFFQQLPPKSFVSFSCLHFNIRSLIKNFAKLQEVIHNCTYPLDIIVITEAGIPDSIVNLYRLPGYNLHSRLRDNKRGGGIIIYVRSYLKFTIIQHKTNTFESLVGTIKLHSKYNIVVCAVYRPPSSNKNLFVSELSKLISKFELKQNLLLIGDTNIDLKARSSYRDAYIEALGERGLMCGITDYTRIEYKQNVITKSCIDHIFARFPTLCPHSAVLDIVLADHRGIIFACMDESPTVSKRIQDVPKYMVDYDIFYKTLKNVDWSQSHYMDSADEILNFIYNSFQNAKAAATHGKTCKSSRPIAKRFNAPWIDANVTLLCNKRNKIHNNWKNCPGDPKLKLEYNKIRNKVNKVIEIKKNTYYLKQISSNFNNIKKVYSIVNQMLGRVTLSIDEAIMKAFDAQGLTPKIIADNFAHNFNITIKNIIPNCKLKLIHQNNLNKSLDTSILFKKATPNDVRKIIKTLNTRKAPGTDNITVADIKHIENYVAPTISDLINQSIRTGSYPNKLKEGCVRPLHKKGRKDEYGNYRPITILSSIDKIVEKYVCDQIHSFYRKHSVITPHQYGFQSGKSTTSLLSKFTDDINTHLNEKRQVLTLFIDFSRAFDTLVHEQIIDRLDNCGIRGPLLNWCQNYLKDRTFSVKVNKEYSKTVSVTEGTAQGSVLGPLLFLSYVNDMGNCIVNSTCYQFADDTCLVIGNKNPQAACDLLQSDLNVLTKWCHDSGLVLNASKTKLMIIKSPLTFNMDLAAMAGLTKHTWTRFIIYK